MNVCRDLPGQSHGLYILYTTDGYNPVRCEPFRVPLNGEFLTGSDSEEPVVGTEHRGLLDSPDCFIVLMSSLKKPKLIEPRSIAQDIVCWI